MLLQIKITSEINNIITTAVNNYSLVEKLEKERLKKKSYEISNYTKKLKCRTDLSDYSTTEN